MDANYLNMHNRMFIDRILKPQGKEISLFLELLEHMPTCKRGNAKLMQMNKSGYATIKLIFMISVPTGSFSITDYMNQAFNSIASSSKPGSNAGCMYADYLHDQGGGNPQ